MRDSPGGHPAAPPVFHPRAPLVDDYDGIRVNGMWYQSWQGGYDDILKRGVPRPHDERTILAELHSPHVPDFLHGGGSSEVPFLVSDRARQVLESRHITGLEFAPVQVVKIATKGARSRPSRSGEPEDVILKAKGVTLDLAPTLFAAYVVGKATARLDVASGRLPSGAISPFDLDPPSPPCDIWRPEHAGRPYSAWVFCSPAFKAACEDEGLSNIAFTTFASFMGHFRSNHG